MYTITSDGFTVYDPSKGKDYQVTKATYRIALNNSGTLDFSCPYTNKGIEHISPMNSLIKLWDNEKLIFCGRVIREKVDIMNNHAYTCEGFMSFLHDTVIEPFEQDERSAEDFLAMILTSHNAQCEDALGNDSRSIQLHTVIAEDNFNILSEEQKDFSSTWAILKNRLIDSDINGFLIPRYILVDGEYKNYVDFVNVFTERNDQKIEFAKNIIDISTSFNSNNLYTAIMPYGKDNITIAPLEDGMITDSIRKRGYNVENVDLIERYGYIVKLMGLYNETDRQVLLQKALDEINLIILPDIVSVSAVDLSLTDDDISALEIGKITGLKSKTHNIEKDSVLSEMNIDLLNPSIGSKLTLGVSK